MKACFANALQMWAYDSRFKYAEGFAAVSDLDIGELSMLGVCSMGRNS